MNYYEIWFYYYGEDDPRTEFDKEFTFYIKSEKSFGLLDDLKQYLRETFPITEKYNVTGINCLAEEDLDNISKWFSISAEEFTDGCGIEA